MREYYEVMWLLIEGRISAGKYLAVQKGPRWWEIPGHVTYQEFAAWLNSMAQRGGVLLYRTETTDESVAWLRGLELWWTAKEWEEHRAHMEMYTPPLDANPFDPPTLACRVAAVLPHIGSVKAERVARHFGSVRKMINASPKEWQEIKGVGKGISEKLIAALEAEE
jgi:ERCC4-type nuclease